METLTAEVEDGIDRSDVAEEGIAETCATCRPLHQPRDVDDGQVRRHARLGLVMLTEPLEPLVSDIDASLLRLLAGLASALLPGLTYRTERKVFCRDRRVGDGVEEGRLPDVGQPHHADLEIIRRAPQSRLLFH